LRPPPSRDLLGQQGRLAAVDGPVVQVRRGHRPAAVQAVQVEGGDAEVPDRLRVLAAGQARGRVEGHVVVEELADEGEAGGDGGVVGVGGALGRVGDQGDRVRQVVAGVYGPAGTAQLGQGGRIVGVSAANGGRVGNSRPNLP